MLFVHVLMRDVHVLKRRMVVVVCVCRQQMTPVLSLVQIMRDVVVLVPVLQGLMLVMSLRPPHRTHPSPDRCSDPKVHRVVEADKPTRGRDRYDIRRVLARPATK